MCEHNGSLRRYSYCADDEWCVGPTNITNSTYQLDSLCVKGNINGFCQKDVFEFIKLRTCQQTYLMILNLVNVSCRPDLRAPGCGLCPKLQDEVDCSLIDGCDRDPSETNNWCIGDCYLDRLDGYCKEKSTL